MFGSMEATKELLLPDAAPYFKGLLPSYNKMMLRVTHLWEPLLVYGVHCTVLVLSQPLPKGGKWAFRTRLLSKKGHFYFQPCLFPFLWPHLTNLVASMSVYLFLFFLSSSATLLPCCNGCLNSHPGYLNVLAQCTPGNGDNQGKQRSAKKRKLGDFSNRPLQGLPLSHDPNQDKC